MVTSYRSRRVEGLLGARVQDATYDNVRSLVTNGVRETYDLDFKEKHYGNSDADKRSLCSDVAALANAAGGIIVIGIAEDDQAQASDDPGVSLDDKESQRIRQIIAAGVSPLPAFDIIPVPRPEDAGQGVLILAVPPSPLRPHAVLVNESLRFPKRHGATTSYLTEAEVSEAYRDRLRRVEEAYSALERYEQGIISMLETDDLGYVVVSIAPDMPGDFMLDTAVFRDFEQSTIGKYPWGFTRGMSWSRARVGRGRLVADGQARDAGKARWLACELYQNGAGSIAIAAARQRDDQADNREMNDEAMVDAVISGLHFLARHARDRAAAGGTVMARATIWPVSESNPARLFHTRFHGIPEPLGRTEPTKPPVAEGVFDLDDLAEHGPGLVSATYRLATGLLQEFGVPEALQMTSEGAIRRRYWRERQSAVVSWAQANGIEVSEDTVRG